MHTAMHNASTVMHARVAKGNGVIASEARMMLHSPNVPAVASLSGCDNHAEMRYADGIDEPYAMELESILTTPGQLAQHI